MASERRPRLQSRGQQTQTRAERNIAWIERHCRIPEGRFVGCQVKLSPFQKTFLKDVYDNPHGTRRAIFSVGRKNAKTTLSAFLLLLHLVGPEAKHNGQLYSDAQSRDQAGIIFELAAKCVRLSPTLNPHVQIRETAKQLLCPELGTKYKALSAEIATSFGLSPVFIVHDELGQVRGPKSELYEALETAVGAQEEPLSVIISTQAPTENDLLSILIDDALKGHDPRTVINLYTCDKDVVDPFTEEAIRQANPAYDDFQNKQELQAMAADAKRMPSRESDYRNLVLNQRVEATNPFITRSLWNTCATEPKDFGKAVVFGGLDLSSVNDLTALVLVAEIEKVWHVKPTFWLPGEGLAERSRLDRVPYDVWKRDGYIELSPGKSVEYEFVADYLRDVFKAHRVAKIAFDRWGFKHLRPWLIKAGFTEKEIEEHFVEFGQGYQSMSPAMRALESILLNGKLAHGGNPVLAMCATNAVVQKDPAGNRKLDKARSRSRIDGMVALTMALGVAESAPAEQPKSYQMMFV